MPENRVRENLVFDKEASDADIQESLENTQLLSMLAALDNGADTRIGEKGACISGGEKQRLALVQHCINNRVICTRLFRQSRVVP